MSNLISKKNVQRLKKKDVHLCDIGNTFERSYMGKKPGHFFGLSFPKMTFYVCICSKSSRLFVYIYALLFFLFCFVFVFYREAVHHWQHKLSTGSSLYFLYDFCFPSRSLFLYFLMSSLFFLTSLFLCPFPFL